MKFRFLCLIALLSTKLTAQATDSIAIKQVDSLIKVSRDLTAKKEFDKALEVNSAAEKIALEKLGKESSAYGNTCFYRGRISSLKNDYPEAEKWYLESKAIWEKVLGKEHLNYVASLNDLANLYLKIGNWVKAEQLFLESKAILEKVHGKEYPGYVSNLFSLAILYANMLNYEKAEPLYLETKEIREKVLGKEHPDYAVTLNNLAILYFRMGQYEKAEPMYQEAIAIKEKVIGKENPDYAGSLINLANLYGNLGQYEKAEPLLLKAKEIFEGINNLKHPFYLNCLMNLGNLYGEMGQYEKAELLFLQAKAILEKSKGKENDVYAACLYNLAELYRNLGQYDKSELLHLESITIIEKLLGKEHEDFAFGLNGLAGLYYKSGQYKKAEPLFLQAKAIRENALGKEHPDYAGSLVNLGDLYLKLGNYKKAEAHFMEAKEIFVRGKNLEHQFYMNGLSGLANLYMAKSQYEKAEPLFQEAKAIREKVLGKVHPNYAVNLNDLAFMYWQMGQYEKAELLYIELSSVNKRLIENAMHHLSENELNNYMSPFSDLQGPILSFSQITNNKNLIPDCYDNSLFYKGFLLSSAKRVKRLALTDSLSTEKYNQLKAYHRLLANEYSKPIDKRDSLQVAELEEQSNTIEKDLTRMVAGYGEAMRQVNWRDVQKKLNTSEASVEFVHYQYYRGINQTDSTMYAALLLNPETKQPIFIPLFEEKQLDSLLKTSGERKADYVNGLYTLADRGAIAIEEPKKSLYELIWKPLEKELLGVKQIYFSPSGLLHRINLDAIPVSETETLADKYQLIDLNSTRQLVISDQLKIAGNDAVLFGGIQYERDSSFKNNEPLLASRSRGELSFNLTDSTLRGGTWNYLAGTEREVNAIEKLMQTSGVQTKLKKAYEATEESFKNIGTNNSPSPRILHVATHGYFFPDRMSSAISRMTYDPDSIGTASDPDKRSGAKAASSESNVLPNESESVFKISEHPMLRSGLIMAGGNAAWKGVPTLEGREDGILTAYEISQMNLSNTELVVLSACETGLGDIQGNEGVYGLQRAFKIAGAKYLIMSLWQVPDKQTSLLMTTFYKKWLEEKMTIPDAFHAAQKELRDNGLDPYNWAGFVLVE